MASRAPAGALTRKSVSAGAATSVWAATSPDLAGRGGRYLEDVHVAGPLNADRTEGVAPHATDPEQAKRLWIWSQEQIGYAIPT